MKITLTEVEKVDRYMNLVGIFYGLDKSIKAKALVQNASQTFLKRKSSSHQQKPK